MYKSTWIATRLMYSCISADQIHVISVLSTYVSWIVCVCACARARACVWTSDISAVVWSWQHLKHCLPCWRLSSNSVGPFNQLTEFLRFQERLLPMNSITVRGVVHTATINEVVKQSEVSFDWLSESPLASKLILYPIPAARDWLQPTWEHKVCTRL